MTPARKDAFASVAAFYPPPTSLSIICERLRATSEKGTNEEMSIKPMKKKPDGVTINVEQFVIETIENKTKTESKAGTKRFQNRKYDRNNKITSYLSVHFDVHREPNSTGGYGPMLLADVLVFATTLLEETCGRTHVKNGLKWYWDKNKLANHTHLIFSSRL